MENDNKSHNLPGLVRMIICVMLFCMTIMLCKIDSKVDNLSVKVDNVSAKVDSVTIVNNLK